MISCQLPCRSKNTPDDKEERSIKMLKENIRIPLVYFLVSTVWQLIADREVKWIDNSIICFFIFLAVLFLKWTEIPYKWNKDKVDED
jgi:hypothetical protein